MFRTSRFYLFGTLFALLVMAPTSLFAAPLRAPSRAPLSAQFERMTELVNAQRSAAGLKPVTINATLMTCAQQNSDMQAARAAISHTGPDGSTPGQRLRRCGYQWTSFGENLAAGFVTADEVVDAWMKSPAHRKVLLHPRVVELGLGHTYRSNDPSRYYDYYTLLVGRR